MIEHNTHRASQLLKESGYDGRPIVLLHVTDIPMMNGAAIVAPRSQVHVPRLRFAAGERRHGFDGRLLGRIRLLRPDYPMVAPSYSKARSELAKALGLGRFAKGARKGGTKGAKKRRTA